MKALLRVLIGIVVLVLLFSGYQLFKQYKKYDQIEEAYSEIAELVVQTIPPETESSATEATSSSDGAELPSENELPSIIESEPQKIREGIVVSVPIIVDFDTLLSINPDVVGWLYCEGTSINYPVLQGESNDTYLYHQYDGTYSAGGSIFMDYRSNEDLSDEYTIIYGHNMLSDTMFNCLDYFRKQSYMDEHSRFFYLTPSGQNYCLDVICCNLTAYKDELRLFEIHDDHRDTELILEKAEAKTDITVCDEDKLVLLSTCTYDFTNAKCTILCKLIPIIT